MIKCSMNLICISAITIVALLVCNVDATRVFVIEYTPIPFKDGKSIHELVIDNVQKLNDMVANIEGLERNDIVVYPEYAILHDSYVNPTDENHCRWWAAALNHVKTIYYQSADLCPKVSSMRDSGSPIASIGCLAEARKIYIAANGLANNNDKIYNIEFVFGPDSSEAISVYNKIHPVSAESSIINAGDSASPGRWRYGDMKAGSMICFDILFEESHRTAKSSKLMVFSTEWTSSQELFVTAVQQGFSRVTNSILLGANINLNTPTFTNTGSGIFVAGRPAAYHVGDIENSIKLLSADVKIEEAIDNFFGDEVVTLDGQGPIRGGGELSSSYRFLKEADDFVAITLHAGDLSCSFDFKDIRFEVANDIVYALRAQSGSVAGRVIRSCTMMAVKKADALAALFKKWSIYNHRILHRFGQVTISGNVHGSNVAILPLITLMDGNNVPTVVKNAHQSKFTYIDRPKGEVMLKLKPDDEGLAIMSIYGVVGEGVPAMADDIADIGDARVDRMAGAGAMEMKDCPLEGAAKPRFRETLFDQMLIDNKHKSYMTKQRK